MSCHYSPVTAHLPQQLLPLLLKTKRSYLLSPGQTFYYLNHICPEKTTNEQKQDYTRQGKFLGFGRYISKTSKKRLPDQLGIFEYSLISLLPLFRPV